MQYYNPNLALLVTAIKKVSPYVLKNFQEISLMGTVVNSNVFALETARFVREKIIDDISKIKPRYSFILPNGQMIERADKSNHVIVSGLININNFQRGIPSFAISLTLLRDNKEASTAIYHPLTDQLYVAEVGKGAFLNKKPLRFSEKQLNYKPLMVATNDSSVVSVKTETMYFSSNCIALELCYVAAGKLDMAMYSAPLNYLEIVSGLMIASEVGHKITYNKNLYTVNDLVVAHPLFREHYDI